MSNSAVNLAALGFGGIDTSTLVSSLVSLQQQPLAQLAQQQANINSASSTISSFSSTLSALKTAATALSDPNTFKAMKASSSDASVVASATGSPVAGQWSVSVSALAQQQRTLSDGTSDSTAALGMSGSLGISLGNGTTANISLTSTDSLSDIADKISSAGLRVSASMMFDGSQYHLLVSGLDTGASNAVTFDESGLTSTGYSLNLSSSTNTIQKAQDAKVTVGGVTVSSASNQVSNAIPGVTLALTTTNTTPATVTIAGDSSSVQSQVQAFVTAYNNVVNSGHDAAGFGTTKASNTMLQGDSAIRSSLDQLGQLTAGLVPGASGAYTTLASVGVSMNNDGTLTFNSGTFSTAMQADPTSVQKLFVTDSNTGASGVMSTFGSVIDSLTSSAGGPLKAEMTSYQQRSSRIGTQITNGQQRLTDYQTQLQNEFNQMNAMLAQYKQQANALDQADGTSSKNSNSVL
jgi:flagellar hook-associated protein 2